jgi:hypothetical protein
VNAKEICTRQDAKCTIHVETKNDEMFFYLLNYKSQTFLFLQHEFLIRDWIKFYAALTPLPLPPPPPGTLFLNADIKLLLPRHLNLHLGPVAAHATTFLPPWFMTSKIKLRDAARQGFYLPVRRRRLAQGRGGRRRKATYINFLTDLFTRFPLKQELNSSETRCN